jgi:hypothetical protein
MKNATSYVGSCRNSPICVVCCALASLSTISLWMILHSFITATLPCLEETTGATTVLLTHFHMLLLAIHGPPTILLVLSSQRHIHQEPIVASSVGKVSSSKVFFTARYLALASSSRAKAWEEAGAMVEKGASLGMMVKGSVACCGGLDS